MPRLPVRNQRPQRAIQEETAYSHPWRDYCGYCVHQRLLWHVLIRGLQSGRSWEDTNWVGCYIPFLLAQNFRVVYFSHGNSWNFTTGGSESTEEHVGHILIV